MSGALDFSVTICACVISYIFLKHMFLTHKPDKDVVLHKLQGLCNVKLNSNVLIEFHRMEKTAH